MRLKKPPKILNRIVDKVLAYKPKAWHERMEIDLKDNLRFLNTREGGALRRASMDLTRALAAMRKY